MLKVSLCIISDQVEQKTYDSYKHTHTIINTSTPARTNKSLIQEVIKVHIHAVPHTHKTYTWSTDNTLTAHMDVDQIWCTDTCMGLHTHIHTHTHTHTHRMCPCERSQSLFSSGEQPFFIYAVTSPANLFPSTSFSFLFSLLTVVSLSLSFSFSLFTALPLPLVFLHLRLFPLSILSLSTKVRDWPVMICSWP